MTDRETLVALIKEADCSSLTYGECSRCKYGCKGDCSYQFLADHLIANGVTFATDNHVGGKWIPVTERLPEEDGSYLCFSQYCGSGWCAVRGFAKDGRKKDEYDFQRRWKNVWYDYDSEYGYCVIDSITHWMPLPEPPKEGE